MIIDLEKIKDEILNHSEEYYSQLKQDILAIVINKHKTHGFFVEFGACDGIENSNTLLLEKKYQWNGILAEPCVSYNTLLEKNRSAQIDKRAVFGTSNQLINFKEVVVPSLSGIESFFGRDKHSKVRKKGRSYQVQTVSLFDLLEQNNSPNVIDYLSIDTEGSEFDILKNFNFNSKYHIKLITVEHNYIQHNRERLKKLLEEHSYIRILPEISKWDDWYIRGLNYEKNISNRTN